MKNELINTLSKRIGEIVKKGKEDEVHEILDEAFSQILEEVRKT